MTDRIDVEELVERLKGLAAEGALIHTFSWGLVVSLLSDAATALSALKQYAALGRACESNGLGWYGDDGDMYFQAPADAIEEHATEWAKAALSALEEEREAEYDATTSADVWMAAHKLANARAQAAETELSALKALVGRMVEGLEEVTDALEAEVKARAGGELPRRIARDLGPVVRARSLLSVAKGEGER